MKKTILVITVSMMIGLAGCGGDPYKEIKGDVVHVASPDLLLQGPVKIPLSEYKSDYMSPTPQVVIYLPAGYETNDAKYPVLYMHDGQNLDKWKIAENVSALVGKGLIPPIIVVGIYHRGDKRIFDYSPTFNKNIGFGETSGGLTNYGKFLVEVVKPYIDSHYRTLAGRENTAVMGSSMGGLASFNLLGWYPEIFSKAGCLSPILRWNVVEGEKLNKHLFFEKDAKIYIDGGWMETVERWDMIPSMRKILSWLNAFGFTQGKQYYYYELPSGNHNEYDWSMRLYIPLMYFFGNSGSGVRELSLTVLPVKIGKGDISTVIPVAELSNGMKMTPIPGAFQSSDPKTASVDKWGAVTGLKEGAVKITYQYGGIVQSVDMNVMAKSRDAVSVTVKITVPQGSPDFIVRILSLNGKSDNTAITPKKADSGEWTIGFDKMKGDYMNVELVLKDGKKAINSKGETINKKLVFTAPKEFHIDVAEWK
ncbi:MAG: alpha/beta hydrolase [Brevinematales bacterium]|nr:alpha/beta hydrolase [Brevinematales bacterium]